jgi:DNA-binding response OmpR family regulator
MDVLLIDDDQDFLHLLSRSLKNHGFNVYTALNGMKALGELDAHKTDIVISDVLMADTPIMSLICTLRRLYPQLPIILTSGLEAEPLIRNSLLLGANEFVPKPININRLCERINKLAA